MGLITRSVANGLNNLAVFLATYRLDEAEPIDAARVTILKQSLGPDHPNTLPREAT